MKDTTRRLALLALVWSFAAGAPGRGAELRHVGPDDATASSRAVVVGGAALAHTGQLFPVDRRGRVPETPEAQAAQALDNVAAALAEVKADLDGLVKLNVY